MMRHFKIRRAAGENMLDRFKIESLVKRSIFVILM
tara:strand:- start:480 stop:584 length:105 start_codon:yes stop_codon:yes gene_type:complete